jgi:hypothetical protein
LRMITFFYFIFFSNATIPKIGWAPSLCLEQPSKEQWQKPIQKSIYPIPISCE